MPRTPGPSSDGCGYRFGILARVAVNGNTVLPSGGLDEISPTGELELSPSADIRIYPHGQVRGVTPFPSRPWANR